MSTLKSFVESVCECTNLWINNIHSQCLLVNITQLLTTTDCYPSTHTESTIICFNFIFPKLVLVAATTVVKTVSLPTALNVHVLTSTKTCDALQKVCVCANVSCKNSGDKRKLHVSQVANDFTTDTPEITLFNSWSAAMQGLMQQDYYRACSTFPSLPGMMFPGKYKYH